MTDQPLQDSPSSPVGSEVVHRTEDPSKSVACDRCLGTPAEIAVRCYLGCSHDQCAGCARQTQQERDDEIAYDSQTGPVVDPFCTSSHACTPGGEPVRCSRPVDHAMYHRCPKCLMRWAE